VIDFVLPPELEAHEPPEARGGGRDDVRLLVGSRSTGVVSHHAFRDLPALLDPGDVLVVNRSATVPAALDAGDLVVHLSTELRDGSWLLELRRPQGAATVPYPGGRRRDAVPLPASGSLRLIARHPAGRLWRARVEVAGDGDLHAYLRRHGRPIRYGYVDRDWPLEAYQTVFADEPGSAEMPSAGRPFTAELVCRLVAGGVSVAPLTLHTGVASPEAHEKPYPERFAVPTATARAVNEARRDRRRVLAVGTTVVRALESSVTAAGTVRATAGWTDLVVTPERGVHVVDGLLTGLHEPRASHLAMLEAVAGHDLLARSYAEALHGGYRWHEFGDLTLLLP
jgi:S-adenosylmethionine:tRNA ribosyltransferase-isomerase